MAISQNTPIDFAKIASEMRSTVALWYNAEVEIYDPNLRDLQWDPVTNTTSGDPEVIIWSGKARIQPVRSTATPEIGVGQGAIRGIRVQVPHDPQLDLIRKGLQVRVTDGGEDKVLEQVEFVVKSAINSSYGWNRTIECDVDVKSVANG